MQYAPTKILFNTVTACKCEREKSPNRNDSADLRLTVIYGQNSAILKSKGYESQSFERQHAALFNCTSPEWVLAKKKMIGPAMGSKQVSSFHAESVGAHTQTLLSIVGSGQPCDMSALGT